MFKRMARNIEANPLALVEGLGLGDHPVVKAKAGEGGGKGRVDEHDASQIIYRVGDLASLFAQFDEAKKTSHDRHAKRKKALERLQPKERLRLTGENFVDYVYQRAAFD